LPSKKSRVKIAFFSLTIGGKDPVIVEDLQRCGRSCREGCLLTVWIWPHGGGLLGDKGRLNDFFFQHLASGVRIDTGSVT
jgi:hypothetical protein